MKHAAALAPVAVLLLAATIYWHATSVSVSDYKTHLSNKVVLLCGAGFGIGEELAYELAAHGAKLVLVGRTEDKVLTLKRMAVVHDISMPAIRQVEKLMVARTESRLETMKAKALRLGSPQVEFFSEFDFSNVSDAHTLVDATVEMMGGLDYVILNHAESPRGYFLNIKHHQAPGFMDRMFSINVFSYIQIALRAMPYLEKSKGHIFVTSSALGEVPAAKLPVFSATKHALNGFFYSLQQELLAKKSSVTISIGALGMIFTEEMMGMFKVPDWMMGDLTGCAHGMMETLVTRPRTFTYPKLHPYLTRFKWYFNLT